VSEEMPIPEIDVVDLGALDRLLSEEAVRDDEAARAVVARDSIEELADGRDATAEEWRFACTAVRS
jgi:hypothetical protein